MRSTGRQVLRLAVLLAAAQAFGKASSPAEPPCTLEIIQLNRVGGSFRLESVELQVDGTTVFFGTRELGLLEREALPLHLGTVPPGWHTVRVELLYRGQKRAQSYRGRRYRVSSSLTLNARPEQRLSLRVVAFEREGFQALPGVRFESR